MNNNYSKFSPIHYLKKFVYGLNVDFRRELHQEIRKEIKIQIDLSWAFIDPFDTWHLDYTSPELRHGFYPKEMPRYLIASIELKREVADYNVTQKWYELNRISHEELERKTNNLRMQLSNLGRDYYEELNKFPRILSSFSEEEIGRFITNRKIIAQLLLVSPFYKDRNPDLRNGVIVKFGLLYNLVLFLSLLGLLGLKKPTKTLTWLVLKSKSYDKNKQIFFEGLEEISQYMVRGQDAKLSTPSLNIFFGEKIFKKLNRELDNLSSIKVRAARLYIEYLLCQYASFDIKPNSISFGKNGLLNISLPNPKLFLIEPKLTEFENEVLTGCHDTGAYKESIMLGTILEYFSNSKNDLPIEVAYKIIKDRFSSIKYINSYPGEKAIEEKLKKISQTNSKKGIGVWLKGLSFRLSQNS